MKKPIFIEQRLDELEKRVERAEGIAEGALKLLGNSLYREQQWSKLRSKEAVLEKKIRSLKKAKPKKRTKTRHS